MECIYGITKPAGIYGIHEGCNPRKEDHICSFPFNWGDHLSKGVA